MDTAHIPAVWGIAATAFALLVATAEAIHGKPSLKVRGYVAAVLFGFSASMTFAMILEKTNHAKSNQKGQVDEHKLATELASEPSQEVRVVPKVRNYFAP